jgi:EAL domain-containing protein (putative c-di-GMP-specific phosphodiesterase class I)
LREALRKDDQLVMHYQPQIDIGSGKVIGLEALIRWRHPRLTWLPPNHFIPIAEMCGLMPELGNWVLRSVCQQIGDWQEAGTTVPTIAVNLSASQFSAASLISDIDTTLQAFHLSPALIELELTESASMHDPQASIAIMSQLRQMGLKISIDDFGTGYSNLAYLKRFPVDRLKLDQAFVRDIATDANDLAISRTIIAIAQQLNLEVVAEGVETTAQMTLLADAGCHTMQGYLYSPAVPADQCIAVMQKNFIIQ